jgi:glycosyltransferase involved in cell wall biosynthesis
MSAAAKVRVLVVAPKCAPASSEVMMGYQMARAIGKHVDAVVATHCYFEDSINASGGLGQAEPAYIDLHKLSMMTGRTVRRFKMGAASGTLAQFPLAVAFERAVWRRFRKELSEERFDIVHRLTPQSSALPSLLASWSPVPFVIGPVNGGLPYPKQFRAELHREREWLRYVRGVVNVFPYVKTTYRKAAAVLASGQHTIDHLPIRNRNNVFNMSEIGFDPADFAQPVRHQPSDKLTFVFVGRLVPFKCPRIAIAAFGASALLRRHRLLVVGDGPDRGLLEEQVRSLGLESTVEFAGARPVSEIPAIMQAADVFVFPSIRESGGLVVVEAMASGLPCVVTDYGGPGDAVAVNCGIKIPLGSAEQLIGQFKDKLEQLASDPELRERLSTAARKRALDVFTWERKARMFVEIYRWVLGRRPDKPDLDSVVGEDAMHLPQSRMATAINGPGP